MIPISQIFLQILFLIDDWDFPPNSTIAQAATAPRAAARPDVDVKIEKRDNASGKKALKRSGQDIYHPFGGNTANTPNRSIQNNGPDIISAVVSLSLTPCAHILSSTDRRNINVQSTDDMATPTRYHLNPPRLRRNNQWQTMIEHGIRHTTAIPLMTAYMGEWLTKQDSPALTTSRMEIQKKNETPVFFICPYSVIKRTGPATNEKNSEKLKLTPHNCNCEPSPKRSHPNAILEERCLITLFWRRTYFEKNNFDHKRILDNCIRSTPIGK